MQLSPQPTGAEPPVEPQASSALQSTQCYPPTSTLKTARTCQQAHGVLAGRRLQVVPHDHPAPLLQPAHKRLEGGAQRGVEGDVGPQPLILCSPVRVGVGSVSRGWECPSQWAGTRQLAIARFLASALCSPHAAACMRSPRTPPALPRCETPNHHQYHCTATQANAPFPRCSCAWSAAIS